MWVVCKYGEMRIHYDLSPATADSSQYSISRLTSPIRAPHSTPDFQTIDYIQIGQPSVNPPRLVLEVGGTSALQAAVPGELKSPPTWNLEVGGTSTLQAQLPARLKSPPLQAQVWGGSRWADLAVSFLKYNNATSR